MKLIRKRAVEIFRPAIVIGAILLLCMQAQAARISWGATVNPNPINFGRHAVGTTSAPVTVTLHNYGRTALTISGVSLSSLQVTYSGPALPVTLNAGGSLTATVQFSPTATQNYGGVLTFTVRNGANLSARFSGIGVATSASATTPPASTNTVTTTPPPTTTTTTTTTTPPPTTTTPPAAAPGQLTLTPSALSFGSVNLNASTSQTVTLSNSGGTSVTLSTVTVSGPGFNATGASSGLVLAPGQTSPLTVTFAPAATGAVTGSIKISSNAATATSNITLAGSGAAAPAAYSASLSWSPETAATNGYNVYGGTTSGGPYTKLTSSPVVPTSYTDTSVTAGSTYYFVVTAIGAGNVESGYSNEVSAVVP